jgi:aldose 1-epimerase
LGGHTSGTILDHLLTVNADNYTPTDATYIPTGEIAPVEGTPFDFREPTAMGARIDQVEGGYDLNYAINESDAEGLAFAARVKDPASGRVMEIYTDQPGLQFYTGNFLDASFEGKDGATYPKNSGFCLETQKYPDTPNNAEWPTSQLNPGETYTHTIVHRFSAE